MRSHYPARSPRGSTQYTWFSPRAPLVRSGTASRGQFDTVDDSTLLPLDTIHVRHCNLVRHPPWFYHIGLRYCTARFQKECRNKQKKISIFFLTLSLSLAPTPSMALSIALRGQIVSMSKTGSEASVIADTLNVNKRTVLRILRGTRKKEPSSPKHLLADHARLPIEMSDQLCPLSTRIAVPP